MSDSPVFHLEDEVVARDVDYFAALGGHLLSSRVR